MIPPKRDISLARLKINYSIIFMKKINFFSISVIFFLSIFSASLSQAALIGNTTQATLTLSPDTGTYQAGQTFSVDVIVNTNSQPVNAVAAYINYNPALLAVDAIDYTGSVFTIQWESSINSPVGMIKIGRSIAGSTVNTANGKIATLRLRVWLIPLLHLTTLLLILRLATPTNLPSFWLMPPAALIF